MHFLRSACGGSGEPRGLARNRRAYECYVAEDAGVVYAARYAEMRDGVANMGEFVWSDRPEPRSDYSCPGLRLYMFQWEPLHRIR